MIFLESAYRDLLLDMSRVGNVTEDYILSEGFSKYKIHKMIKNELIKELGNYFIYARAKKLYSLTKKSRDYLKSNFNITFYKTDLTQLEHDYLLMKIYSKLSKDERNTWLNETELKSKYSYTITTADAVFIRNNKKIAVEILTNNYTRDTIVQKKKFIDSYCDDSIILNTNLRKDN